MRRLNVRCCCKPSIIHGTLPWDEENPRLVAVVRDTGERFTLEVDVVTHYVCNEPIVQSAIPNFENITDYLESRRSEKAWKAPHVSIELLRQLPGFIEGDSV